MYLLSPGLADLRIQLVTLVPCFHVQSPLQVANYFLRHRDLFPVIAVGSCWKILTLLLCSLNRGNNYFFILFLFASSNFVRSGFAWTTDWYCRQGFSIFACEGDLTCSILDRFADLPTDSKSSLALFFGFPGFVFFGLVNFAFLFFFGLRSIIKLFCDQKNDWIRLAN
jgi:hypothetical protein